MTDEDERNDAGADRGGPRALTEKEERNIRARQSVRIAVMVIIAGVLVIWTLANTDDTEVDWIFTTTQSPLILVMVASAILGLLFGYIIARRRGD